MGNCRLETVKLNWNVIQNSHKEVCLKSPRHALSLKQRCPKQPIETFKSYLLQLTACCQQLKWRKQKKIGQFLEFQIWNLWELLSDTAQTFDIESLLKHKGRAAGFGDSARVTLESTAEAKGAKWKQIRCKSSEIPPLRKTRLHAVCYRMLQHGIVCYVTVTVCYSMLHYTPACSSMLQYATICYSMLLYATVFYSMLQYGTATVAERKGLKCGKLWRQNLLPKCLYELNGRDFGSDDHKKKQQPHIRQ